MRIKATTTQKIHEGWTSPYGTFPACGSGSAGGWNARKATLFVRVGDDVATTCKAKRCASAPTKVVSLADKVIVSCGEFHGFDASTQRSTCGLWMPLIMTSRTDAIARGIPKCPNCK